MRSILEHSSFAGATANINGLLMASLAEYGWTKADLAITRTDLATLAKTVIDDAKAARRDLPLSPESQFIQDAIDRRFAPSRLTRTRKKPPVVPDKDAGSEPFAPFSFERYCLEQAILILTQIDPRERTDAFQREMTIVVGPEYATYGVIFRALSTGRSANDATVEITNTAWFQTRLRCNDLRRLQTATASYASAINPTKRQGTIRRASSPAASVGRRMSAGPPFQSDVTRLEIRSVANENLFRGDVIPVTGRFSLLRRTVSTGAAPALLALSVLFVALSLVLYAWFPDEGWWMWSEQLMGRLATGAFGALLVDGAIDYAALRRSLMAGSGPVTHGAVINWVRAS